MDIWSDFSCSGCLVCTIPHLSKSVRTTRNQPGASGRCSRQADIEGPKIGGFEAVRSCSEAFLGSQRSPMTPVTIQCTMIHSGNGQGTSKIHLDRLQKAQENMREASAWFPLVHCSLQISHSMSLSKGADLLKSWRSQSVMYKSRRLHCRQQTADNLKRHLWWKRYLTSMQLVQLVVVFVHGTVALIHPTCAFSFVC